MTNTAAIETQHRLPLRLKLLFSLGSLTTSMPEALIAFFHLYFLTDIAGLRPDYAGWAIAAARLWDAINDPLFGVISDRIKSRHGRRRVLLLAVLRPAQTGLVFVCAAFSGLGIATAYVVPWAMLPDIIEHDELETGQRREGSFYALAAFFQKLGTGAALWAMGQALARTGYVSPTASTPLPAQPEQAVLAIRWFASIIPAGLIVISILFARRYAITREAHEQMLERLQDGGKR